MNKKAIALFCALLAPVFVLTACKHDSPYGKIIVDEEGMEHVIMTDAKGVTVVDSEGNLVEVVTDSDSKKPIAVPTVTGTAASGQENEYQTHSVTFPAFVVDGTRAEDRSVSLSIPDGWEQVGENYLILQHKDTGARIMFYTDLEGSLTEALEEMDSTIAKASMDSDITGTQVQIDGIEANRTQYDLGDATHITYLLQPKIGKLCRINCTVQTDRLSDVDFDAVLQTVHFK